jgi:hypothetical protein
VNEEAIRRRIEAMMQIFQLARNQKTVVAMREIVKGYIHVFADVTESEFDEALTKYQQSGKFFFPYPGELYKYVDHNVINFFDWNKPGYRHN